MLEQITLSYDGQRLPLKAVASTTVRDSQTLQVSVFNAEVSRGLVAAGGTAPARAAVTFAAQPGIL